LGLTDLAALVEPTALARFARGSALGYPLASLAHLLGLVIGLGGILLLDLRLAGAFRALPLAAALRTLLPVAWVGLGLLVLSGAMLFSADARALATNPAFRWKLVLIGLALANGALFHAVGHPGRWRDDCEVPSTARALALVSIGLWLAVATCGRFIAYV
jgi:hypothetical protein